MSAVVWDGKTNVVQFFINSSSAESDDFVSYSVKLSRLGNSSEYEVEEEKLTTPDVLILRRGQQAAIQNTVKNTTVGATENILQEKELFLPEAISPLLGIKSLQSYQTELANWCVYQEIRTDQNAPIRQALVSRLE